MAEIHQQPNSIIAKDYFHWGIVMINDEDGSCGGGSGEIEIHLSDGKAHIYYSSDAIKKFVSPLTFSTVAWREF